MSASSVISVVKAANTRTPTRQGFGKSALFAYHTHNTDVFRRYKSVAALEADGFTSAETAHRMLSSAFQQSPRPEEVLVVRAPVAAKTMTVTITDATEGNHITLTVVSPDGTETAIDYTIGAAATLTSVAVAVEALIEACPGISSSPAVAVITVTATTGSEVFTIKGDGLKGCTIADTTADPGYAAALSALLVQTKDFYFVQTEVNSPLAIAAMRAACETAGRMYLWQTSNSVELTSGGTLFSSQKALSPDYGTGFFVKNELEFAPCAAAGVCGTRDPGGYSLNLKELKGVTPVDLTDSEMAFLDEDNANYYVLVANGIQGVLGTNGGSITSGGEYVDIVHGTDWFIARCQEAIIQVQANQDKIDYTDEGVLLYTAALKGVCAVAEKQKLLKAASTVVSFDPTADADPTDKGNRYYPGLKIAGNYAGAIQRSRLELTLTV